MNESVEVEDFENVPLSPAGKISEIMNLTAKEKEAFLPPIGGEFWMGPFKFRVKVTNPSQLRFTASLSDVRVEKKGRIIT